MKTLKIFLESNGKSKSSISSIQSAVYYYLNYCQDQNIEPEESSYGDLLLYIKFLQKRGLKQRTIQIYLNGLNHYFKWTVKRNLRKDNPLQNISIKGIKRQQLYTIITPLELEKLYTNYPIPKEEGENSHHNWYKMSILSAKRNKVILGLLIYQGITTAEVGRLSLSNLKLREGKIFIPGSRKSNERELKLSAHQVLDLMEYTLDVRKELLTINNKESNQLFISSRGSEDIRNSIFGLIEKLRILNTSISRAQQIRVSVIVNWLKKYNLRETQYMAGHKYVSSTENYLLNDPEELVDDIEKFHPIA